MTFYCFCVSLCSGGPVGRAGRALSVSGRLSHAASPALPHRCHRRRRCRRRRCHHCHSKLWPPPSAVFIKYAPGTLFRCSWAVPSARKSSSPASAIPASLPRHKLWSEPGSCVQPAATDRRLQQHDPATLGLERVPCPTSQRGLSYDKEEMELIADEFATRSRSGANAGRPPHRSRQPSRCAGPAVYFSGAVHMRFTRTTT